MDNPQGSVGNRESALSHQMLGFLDVSHNFLSQCLPLMNLHWASPALSNQSCLLPHKVERELTSLLVADGLKQQGALLAAWGVQLCVQDQCLHRRLHLTSFHFLHHQFVPSDQE